MHTASIRRSLLAATLLLAAAPAFAQGTGPAAGGNWGSAGKPAADAASPASRPVAATPAHPGGAVPAVTPPPAAPAGQAAARPGSVTPEKPGATAAAKPAPASGSAPVRTN